MIFLELDQLHKKMGWSFEERLADYEAHTALLEGRDDLYYHLGLALEGQGRRAEAEKCFRNATLGTDELAGAMYYNDQPADMILYQGLAYLKLGRGGEARARFYRLIDYGERHLHDEVGLPHIWRRRWQRSRHT